MDAERIKLEARLFASEYLLANLYAMLFRGSADPASSADAFAGEIRRHMATFAVPGLEPAQSDAFAGEVRDALEMLIDQIRSMTVPSGAAPPRN